MPPRTKSFFIAQSSPKRPVDVVSQRALCYMPLQPTLCLLQGRYGRMTLMVLTDPYAVRVAVVAMVTKGL